MDPQLVHRAAEQARGHCAGIATAGRTLLSQQGGRGGLSEADRARLEFLTGVADVAAAGDDATTAAQIIALAHSGELTTRVAQLAVRMPDTPAEVRQACRELLIRRERPQPPQRHPLQKR